MDGLVVKGDVVHTLSIFDQTENTSNPNENAPGVQRVQTSRPEGMDLHALARGHTYEASVEDASRDDEAGEEENLDHETANDDILAQSHRVEAARCHDTAACALHEERYHISNDEDLGQPSSSDDRVLFAVCDQNDPSQAHVNTRREN